MVVLLVLTVVVNVVTNASATRTDAVKTVSVVPTVILATVPAVAVRSVSASNSLLHTIKIYSCILSKY